MLAFAESKDDVLKALQEDVYFKEGVWDWNKVQIYPVRLHISRIRSRSVSANDYKFKSAFRQPL